MKSTVSEAKSRGRELAPLREQAYKEFGQNPELSPLVLSERLGVHRGTVQTWKARWGKAHGGLPVENKKRQIKTIIWKQLIENVPDIETLGVLTVQGFMSELKRRDDGIEAIKQDNIQLQDRISHLKQELETIAKERNRLMHTVNEAVARGKIGTVTLDQVRHRIIPKE